MTLHHFTPDLKFNNFGPSLLLIRAESLRRISKTVEADKMKKTRNSMATSSLCSLIPIFLIHCTTRLKMAHLPFLKTNCTFIWLFKKLNHFQRLVEKRYLRYEYFER